MNTQRAVNKGRDGDGHDGSSQNPDAEGRTGAHIVSLASPAVARAVVAELLLKPDALTQELRAALQADNADKAMMAALERIVVWADLSSVWLQAMSREERQWREAALRYCVLRGAHYPLLHRLFKVSRAEVARVREENMVSGQTRPITIPDAAVNQVHEAWDQIQHEWRGREADRWVALAERFPQYPLSSLYQLVVGEGQRTVDQGGRHDL